MLEHKSISTGAVAHRLSPLRKAGLLTAVAASLLAAMSLEAKAQLLTPGGGMMDRSRPSLSLPKPVPARGGDYIVAIVNNELVTAAEVDARIKEIQARAGQAALPPETLRQQAVESLVNERAVLTYARENSNRIDESELDRAVNNILAQNQMTLEQLRQRLISDGTDLVRFRQYIKDQMVVERVREREVQGRIKVAESDIDAYIAAQDAKGVDWRWDIAHILVAIPEGMGPLGVSERLERAEALLRKAQAGEDFARLAATQSDDGSTRAQGGRIGVRTMDRIPEVFRQPIQNAVTGQVLAQVVRSPVGFHVVKVLDRQGQAPGTVVQTRARHILMRPTATLTPQAVMERLGSMRKDILSGKARFEDIARQYSEDGSASAGGDLGWAGPGQFVPEFEQTMNALPLQGISEPLVSRFGAHLIQVLERRSVKLELSQRRDQAKAALREQKSEQALQDWMQDIRARAYVEMRDAPTL